MEDICVEWICPVCENKNSDEGMDIVYNYVFCSVCDTAVIVTFEVEVKNVNVTISS